MVILGIETSCDDTGIAIIEAQPAKTGPIFNILSNVVSSQIKTHAPFGGVVPNLAAREHLKNIEPCLKTALKEANKTMKDTRLPARQVDLIAVTIGPGLIPSLLIGVHFAKTLAYKYKIPIVGINHLEGHIIAAISGENSKFLPAIALIVSGGHTQLILIKKFGQYKIIGETRDDAAGECFDKVAKLLGLGYPGGPAISEQATRYKKQETNKFKIQNSKFKIVLPRPMIHHKNFDFSFSGLKTAVLYLVNDFKQPARPQSSSAPALAGTTPKDKGFIQSLCCETQQAIIDVLIDKTVRATKEYEAKTIILSGGVAANEELRKQFEVRSSKLNIKFLTPVKNLCMDNGAMIAMAGYFSRKKATPNYSKFKADANLRLN